MEGADLTEAEASAAVAQDESVPGSGPGGADEDFSDIEAHDVLSVAGTDALGRPVFCFKSANLPRNPQIDWAKLLRFMKNRMNTMVESDYTIVYLHYGVSKENKPKLSWLKKMHSSFDRRYKKNLKALYIVHASMFVKVVMKAVTAFTSSKFRKKIHYITDLSQIQANVHLDKLGIPPVVKVHDAEVVAKLAAKAKKQSGGGGGGGGGGAAAAATAAKTVFGANLGTMAPQYFDEATGLPQIVVDTIKYVRENGLDVEGIFRRSASEVTVREVKATINGGGVVDFEEKCDVHLAAVLLKKFFRELQEPAIGFEFYDAVLANTTADPAIKCAELAALFDANMPERNKLLLCHVFSFLCEVSAQSEVNKMTNSNIAVVFGPNMLWSNTPGGGFADIGKVNQFTRFMLENRNFEKIVTTTKADDAAQSQSQKAQRKLAALSNRRQPPPEGGWLPPLKGAGAGAGAGRDGSEGE